MPPLNQVVSARKQDHEPKQQTPPIHPIRRHGDRTGEQREDQNGQQPAESSDVDGHPSFSKRPFPVGEGFAFQAFEHETADRDAVGGK